MSDRTAEIAKIEHELAILRGRYEIFEYWAKVVKWFCISTTACVVVMLVAAFVYGLARDPVAAAFVCFFVLSIVGTFYLYSRYETFRWIDVASPPPGWPRGRMFNIGPKSEAEAIEGLIADREARLAELRGSGR